MLRLDLYESEWIVIDYLGEEWNKLKIALNRLDTRKRIKDDQGRAQWIFHFGDFQYFRERLDKLEFEMGTRTWSPALRDAYRQWKAQVEELEQFSNLTEYDLSDFGDIQAENGFELYPHQRVGIAYLLKSYFLGVNPLLADEQGLGKTIQVLMTAHILGIYNEIDSCWIFCPKTIMKSAWGRDAKRFTGRTVKYVEGDMWTRRVTWATESSFFKIANYEAGRNDNDFIQALIAGKALKVKVGRKGAWDYTHIKEYYVTEEEISNIVGLQKNKDGILEAIYERLQIGEMFVGLEPKPFKPSDPTQIARWREDVKEWEQMLSFYKIPRDFWGRHLIEVEKLPPIRIPMRVVDEAHKIKNHSAGRTKAIKAIRSDTTQRTFIINTTGTPILNRMSEAWSIYDDLWPGYLGTHNHFREKYCVEDGWGNVTQYKNAEELRQKIQRFMLRRRKDEVLNLPEKQYETIQVELSAEERRWYNKLAEEFEVWLAGEVKISAMNILSQMTRFKQLCDSAEILSGRVYQSSKMKELKEDIIDVFQSQEEGRPPRKIVLFTQYVTMLKILMRELKEHNPVGIWGDVENSRSRSQEKLLESLRERNPNKPDWQLILEYNESIKPDLDANMEQLLQEMRDARKRRMIRDYARKHAEEYVDEDMYRQLIHENLPENPTPDDIVKAKNVALAMLYQHIQNDETILQLAEEQLGIILEEALVGITEEDVYQRYGIKFTREDVKDRFQEDPNVRIFLGQYEAAGVGLTLTAADTVYLYDKTWVPADGAQAQDRCHRIGTTGTVVVKDLECVDTIEERLREIWESKQDLFDQFVESEQVLSKLGKSDLLWLVKGGQKD